MTQLATPTQTMTRSESVALTDEVRAATKAFAAALAETPEWQDFEDAAVSFKHDGDDLRFGHYAPAIAGARYPFRFGSDRF